MKTSKKLLSLLLVAMMLVSAVPFQVFAADSCTVTVNWPDAGLVNEAIPFEGVTSVSAADMIDMLELKSNNASDVPYINYINSAAPFADGSRLDLSQVSSGNGNGNGGGSYVEPIGPGAGAGSNNGGESENPPSGGSGEEAFDVSINVFKNATGGEYDFVYAAKYSTISFAEIVAQAGTGSNVTITYDMGGSNNQTLAAGGTITVTAPCFVWIRLNTQSEGGNSGNQGGNSGNQGGTGSSSYTITLDLAEGNTEPGFLRKYTVVEGQRLSFLNDFAYMERNGMTFVRWAYTANGKTATAEDLYDPANGTGIKAIWNLQTYFLTMDENRQGEEYVNYGTTIKLGDDLWAAVNKWAKPTRKGYVFMGWSLQNPNGNAGAKIIQPGDTYQYPGDSTAYAVWELAMANGQPVPPEKDGKVYLEIYLNGKYGELAKRVDITRYAADNKITRAEVESIVKKYYGPKTGYKLAFEGLFDEDTWWWYTRDPETDGAEYITVNGYDDAYIFVMVKNVKITYADPSNPKTGDYILTTGLTLMAVSGIAAAAVYVTGKKRK